LVSPGEAVIFWRLPNAGFTPVVVVVVVVDDDDASSRADVVASK
jgi:hypothetical protein